MQLNLTSFSEMGRWLKNVMLLLNLLVAIFAQDQTECDESRCSPRGPVIRFPFRLKGHRQPDHCGYPGFDLYCDDRNQTVLELKSSVKVLVMKINYKSQTIEVYDHQPRTIARLHQYLSTSASPFSYEHGQYMYNYTVFNCSSSSEYVGEEVPCLGAHIYALYYSLSVSELPAGFSCTPIFNISSSVLAYIFCQNPLNLYWSDTICGNCEAHGKKCRLKKTSTTQPKKTNTTQPDTECFDMPNHINGAKTRRLLLAAGVILGFFLLMLAIIILYRVHSSDKVEKENQVRIEKFLEDYKALKPTRYSYADIKRITNQFKEKLGQGGYGTVFKGKLSSEILVAVKILNQSKGNGDEFINEVGTMCRIHHVNVVRLVGFCAEGLRRALVYEFLPNESLGRSIFSGDHRKHSLGWERLQDIAIGIAKGIEYLHQGCDLRILHFDIKPHNILLDHSFNPKISDFGLAKLCSKEQSAVSMSAARGTMGYIAPEVLSRNFGNVSYKSDVYSFGMVLLEMVGGRKNIDANVENKSQVNFPEWAYSHLDQGEEMEIRIKEDGDANIAKKLTLVGLWCIQWYPVDRPYMKVVVQMLESKGNNLPMPPNPFGSTIQKKPRAALPRIELTVISESE